LLLAFVALLVLAVAGVVAVVVASSSGSRNAQPGTSAPPPPRGGVNRGDVAPDFELTTLDGTKVRLSSFRGRPVVVNFWASWCAPCRREFPELRKAYTSHRDAGLVVLGVVSWNDIPSDARDFVKQERATWPMPVDSSKAAETAYSVPYMPQTVFVGRDGRIALRVYAELTTPVLDRGLAGIL
jgi:peroxiredoxin